MRILIVEDDTKTASFIMKGLKQAGFAVEHAPDGEDGLHRALTETYVAAVVDIMLPKLDGLTLIDQLRKRKVMTPDSVVVSSICSYIHSADIKSESPPGRGASQ